MLSPRQIYRSCQLTWKYVESRRHALCLYGAYLLEQAGGIRGLQHLADIGGSACWNGVSLNLQIWCYAYSVDVRTRRCLVPV